MHPFGGTPICPRCNKAVYAAEQVMGPGRKLYHKPCLTCTLCNKRLDSLTLVEHDQEPYCKICHVRTFGTRDLRQANLPHKDELSPSPFPTSPVRSSFPAPINVNGSPARSSLSSNLTGSTSPTRLTFPTHVNPVRANLTGTGPILRANSVLPARYNRSPISPPTEIDSAESEAEEEGAAVREIAEQPDQSISFEGSITNTERVGDIQLPRTVPLSPSKSNSDGSKTAGWPNSNIVDCPASPVKSNATGPSPTVPSTGMGIGMLKQTTTGTRYGAALGGGNTSPGKTWGLGGTTPVCPRCGKNVYFAEQMKAVGKTWHKGCLRCTSCNTPLDSKRLNERDGDPLCGRCYNKLHGPQGNGYALLGKAGG